MKKIILIACLLPVFFGCEGNDDAQKEPKKSREPEKIALKCGNYDVGIELTDKELVSASINGEKIEMRRAVAASGEKYEGRGAVVSASLLVHRSPQGEGGWNKDSDWSLSLDGGRQISCRQIRK